MCTLITRRVISQNISLRRSFERVGSGLIKLAIELSNSEW